MGSTKRSLYEAGATWVVEVYWCESSATSPAGHYFAKVAIVGAVVTAKRFSEEEWNDAVRFVHEELAKRLAMKATDVVAERDAALRRIDRQAVA